MRLDVVPIPLLLIFGVGIAFLAVFTLLRLSQKGKQERCSLVTNGTVEDYVYQGIGRRSGKLWRPVFEYRANGSAFRKLSHFGTSKKMFPIGQRVTIRYNPDNAEEYYVEELNVSDILQKVFLFSGVALILAGVIFSLF